MADAAGMPDPKPINTADRLMKLAAAATKAAYIDMQLAQERDGKHGLAADIVFSEADYVQAGYGAVLLDPSRQATWIGIGMKMCEPPSTPRRKWRLGL
jgi:hypothetical protein